ncbi:hypothetical protein N0V90_000809 [Kalmusia sp. IMI 367209]|nr:hypothetical protein N0V90_000809 [Kalmusia sp. IMI 367209]
MAGHYDSNQTDPRRSRFDAGQATKQTDEPVSNRPNLSVDATRRKNNESVENDTSVKAAVLATTPPASGIGKGIVDNTYNGPDENQDAQLRAYTIKLKKDNALLAAEKVAALQKATIAQEALADATKRSADDQNKVAEAVKKYADTHSRIKDTRKIYARLEESYARRLTEKDNAVQENKLLEQQMKDLRQKNSDLATEKLELMRLNYDIAEESAILKSENAELVEHKLSNEARMKDLEADLEELKRLREHDAAKLEQYKAIKEDKDKLQENLDALVQIEKNTKKDRKRDRSSTRSRSPPSRYTGRSRVPSAYRDEYYDGQGYDRFRARSNYHEDAYRSRDRGDFYGPPAESPYASPRGELSGAQRPYIANHSDHPVLSSRERRIDKKATEEIEATQAPKSTRIPTGPRAGADLPSKPKFKRAKQSNG